MHYLLIGIWAALASPSDSGRPEQAVQASVKLSSLHCGLRELLRTSDPGKVTFRSREVLLDPTSTQGAFTAVEECIGTFTVSPTGLRVEQTLLNVTADQAQLPRREESFYSFYTGTITRSTWLMGNPNPQTLMSEWFALPPEWWLMIGRVPPMPFKTALFHEREASPTTIVAKYVHDNGSIEVEFEREAGALCAIVHRTPEGRVTRDALLIGRQPPSQFDPVPHPSIVLVRQFQENGSLASVEACINVVASGFDGPRTMIGGGAPIGVLREGATERKISIHRSVIEDLESWFHEAPSSAQSQSLEPLYVHNESLTPASYAVEQVQAPISEDNARSESSPQPSGPPIGVLVACALASCFVLALIKLRR
jgi:hypothetical protein